jgi:hypothetical protein
LPIFYDIQRSPPMRDASEAPKIVFIGFATSADRFFK